MHALLTYQHKYISQWSDHIFSAAVCLSLSSAAAAAVTVVTAAKTDKDGCTSIVQKVANKVSVMATFLTVWLCLLQPPEGELLIRS
jgi:hypothetical protein